jgi:iron complex outermembrane recepter protein
MNQKSVIGGGLFLLCTLVFAPADLRAQSAETGLEEIIVTATRREQALSDVPISVAAFSQEQLDDRGLKDIDGIARYTPGLVVDRAANGANDISIRGISSSAGAATVGVYIDDTPIQVRNLAYNSGTAFPGLFDLERVEVLRGPQGTLFGAGSQGGTVRFIQKVPSLTESSSYTRGEWSYTDGGDPSYEFGGAYGAPFSDGRAGFRASLLYREDGGYIDGISATPVVLDPTGDAGPASLGFTNVRATRPNTNSATTLGGRIAFRFAPTDSLEITPSVIYQRLEVNDGYNVFWPAASSGGYARPVFDIGSPANNPLLNDISAPNKEEGTDSSVLTALSVQWSRGPVEFFSNTSYFDRDSKQWFDFTQFYLWFYALAPDFWPSNGEKSTSLYHNTQENIVQEFRVQSADDDARLTWVAGLFYSDTDQVGVQRIPTNFIANQPEVGAFYLPPFLHGYTDGPPYGPGHSAFENYFGVVPDPDFSMWSIRFRARDKQLAGFAQLDYELTPALTLTAGLRYSKTDLDFAALYSSAETNQNSPYGQPPALPPLFSANQVQSSGDAATPKVGLSYHINDDNMLYVSAAKGFRPAGANQGLPLGCNPELIELGYVDSAGNPQQPLAYEDDSVWSYELGTKNSLLDGRVVVDASVYSIDWEGIQSSIALGNCAESFVTNISEARAQGIDLALQLNPTPGLSITSAIGFNKSTYESDAFSPGQVRVITANSYVTGAPPPRVYSLSAAYEFQSQGGRGYFVRADLTGSAEQRRIGQTDPNSPNFSPDLQPTPSYRFMSLRLGADLLDGAASLELFVNNLTDEDPHLALANRSSLTGANRYTWTDQTLRPRTVGLYFTYRTE